MPHKNRIPKKGNAMIAFSFRRKAFFDHSHCSAIPLFLSPYQVIVGDGGVHSVCVYGGELVVAGIGVMREARIYVERSETSSLLEVDAVVVDAVVVVVVGMSMSMSVEWCSVWWEYP